tara:strand:+ start:53 stop:319 length:267 start_codon:yes stop_codon:yes gene_type:complete
MTAKIQKLPKWFTGECYTHGDDVTNRFSGDSCYLNNVELSMYDFIMGASLVLEMSVMGSGSKQMQTELRKGMDWFRKTNPVAYMVLLD